VVDVLERVDACSGVESAGLSGGGEGAVGDSGVGVGVGNANGNGLGRDVTGGGMGDVRMGDWIGDGNGIGGGDEMLMGGSSAKALEVLRMLIG